MKKLVLPLDSGEFRTVSASVITTSVSQYIDEEYIGETLFDALNEKGPWGEGDVAVFKMYDIPKDSLPINFERQFESALALIAPSLEWDTVELALCTGSPFHADLDKDFRNSFFSIMWLGEDNDSAWDLYFPNINVRIPLSFGKVIVFDPGQPHGVVLRGRFEFCDRDFAREGYQLFLARTCRLRPEIYDQLGISTVDKGIEETYRVNPFNGQVTF